MTDTTPALFDALRQKAGDGTTDFFVEVRQSDLATILDRVDELLDERQLGPQPHRCLNPECGTISYGSGYTSCPRCGGTDGRDDPCEQTGRHVCGPVDSDLILGRCPHGVDLDQDICPEGCRV